MSRDASILNLALLVARLVGLGMAAHGAQKLFGWFGGHGLAGTGGVFEKLGFRPGKLFALAAGAGEFFGGLLLALGLGGPLGPALIVLVMTVAGLTVHVKNGFLQGKNGFELNAVYIALALVLGYSGPGELSLDHALHLHVLGSIMQVTIAFAIAVVLALLNVVARRPPAAS
jgi:putative oxidoreductase